MEIRKIFKIIPIPIFYTDRIKDGFSGVSYGMWIKIRPRCKNDEGLLQHELTHCKQWYRTFGIHGILTLISKKWRYKSELEAYAVQASYEHSPVAQKYACKLFAGFIANKYNLDVSEEDAFLDLCNILDV